MFDHRTDLGRHVRRMREGRGLSIRALAEAAQESPTMIARIENGKAEPESWQLDKIGEALGTKRPLSEYAVSAIEREAEKIKSFAKSEPFVAASLIGMLPPGSLARIKADILLLATRQLKKQASAIAAAAVAHDERTIGSDSDLYDNHVPFAAVESVAVLLSSFPESGIPGNVRSARSELRALAEITSPDASEIEQMILRACELLLPPNKRADEGQPW